MPVASRRFTDHLAEHLALCVAHRRASLDPSTLVALFAVHATYGPFRAGAQVVLAGPCGQKTQDHPIEVCPDNQKANLVILVMFSLGC